MYRTFNPRDLFNDRGKNVGEAFWEWYNNEHRHSGIHYVTPAQRHNGEDKEILAKRKEVYNQVKERRPE